MSMTPTQRIRSPASITSWASPIATHPPWAAATASPRPCAWRATPRTSNVMRAGGPAKDSLGNLYFGLHYAIVCQNKDPDNLNRIKVRFPWLDKGDTDQTHWAQLLTPMEGKKFGWYTVPDVDDVVVVMFIAGDPTQPVILGGVWSTKDVSPEPNEDGKNNFRGYRTRA